MTFLPIGKICLILHLIGNANSLCKSEIFCKGKLLETVQMAHIFPDSKIFVDLKMITDEKSTLQKFDRFLKANQLNPSKKQIQKFVKDNFKKGEELGQWTPPDFTRLPPFLKKIKSGEIRNFAQEIVNLWPTLARKVKQEVIDNPQFYSLIPVMNGFIIPGGRFREFYYWDSYWIIKGLLLCNMYETVKGMLENFITMVKKYDFVPNGSRIYYLDRSQPPLLTLMVGAYIEATNDTAWLNRNIKTLEKELYFFINTQSTQVIKDGTKYILAYYFCNEDTPRPESYFEDVDTASSLHTDEEKKRLYADLRSAAESGWDFSSRWIVDKDGGNNANLTYTNTRRIIPVDLNAFLCQAFRKMSQFYLILNDCKRAFFWLEKSNAWRDAIEKIFYNKKDGIWYDWDNVLQAPRTFFYPSNFAPLWTRAYDFSKSDEYGKRAVEYLIDQGILQFDAGIPTSLVESGEQWDYPNGWPPLQSMVILGLDKTGNVEAQRVAQELAERWIYSNLIGFYETGKLFEKYNVQVSGEFGAGGEYDVQSGFGWTNGILLELIDRYYT